MFARAATYPTRAPDYDDPAWLAHALALVDRCIARLQSEIDGHPSERGPAGSR